MPASLSFFDMSASVTPPVGYLEPVPLTLGPNWQPNDVRILMVNASATAPSGWDDSLASFPVLMTPSVPTGFSAAWNLNPGHETQAVFYRRLVTGDASVGTTWVKPTNWRHWQYTLLTVRGVSPTAAIVAGPLTLSHAVAAATATVASVTVPAAGTMVFAAGSIPDPEIGWPNWAISMGVPTGWTALTATDKSGASYYAYDTNPALVVAGKAYSAAGTTGTVSIPVAAGASAFTGLYVFLPPASDVSITVGAA
jgi:hypothetical protein